MPAPLEFFFDFPSAYAYFAALEIDELAARHGRETRWRAFSLGTAFKRTNAQPLTRTPLKSDYATLDWTRIARRKGLDFAIPDGHPHAGLPALRGFHFLDARDPDLAKRFAMAVFRGYFSGALSIDDVAEVAEIARPFGLEPDAFAAGVSDPAVKALARDVGEQAVARSVFGVPWVFVDGEPFWGCDRLTMVETALAGE